MSLRQNSYITKMIAGAEFMNDIIILSDIGKIYHTKENSVTALKNINFRIKNGEFVSIIGKSGSGKSTLMNIIGCLDTSTYGKYILDGICVENMNEKELSFIRNNRIGFIFQGFNLISTLNAAENVELPLLYRGIKRNERHKIAIEALEKVGLQHRINHKPNELSGGQQQRVAIARAIAAAPKLILADEPTGNLDSKSGTEIMNILKNLNDEGTTIVLITHDNKVAEMAQRCIKISDGMMI